MPAMPNVERIARITPQSGPWPLHDVQATRAAEAQAAAAAPAAHGLMALAGQAVARLALAIAPHGQRVCVLAGPGNNGGDGFIAARWLHTAGRRVQVWTVGDRDARPADAADAYRQACAAGVPIAALPADAASHAHADVLIDALLGIGLRRPPDGELARAIALACSQRAPVLAVDLPSGLHADSGMPVGSQAVRATATLALLTLKPGCFTGRGRDHAGDVWLDTLGWAVQSPSAHLLGPPTFLAREHASHKGRFGDVVVIGGARGMVGAAWLAARAALTAGAGRVHMSLLDPTAPGLDPQRPELMVLANAWTAPPAWLAARTVVCGCGGGAAVREALPALLAHAGRLVLDADALNAIALEPTLRDAVRRRGQRGGATLLTPHPLEAARLLDTETAAVQAQRIAVAQRLADTFAATVVLKGSGSVVCAPDGPVGVNPTGNGTLASAGTGDVLAGWCAGLWAQQPRAAAYDVAAAAVWVHGRAADQHVDSGQGGSLLANDLVDMMARVAAR